MKTRINSDDDLSSQNFLLMYDVEIRIKSVLKDVNKTFLEKLYLEERLGNQYKNNKKIIIFFSIVQESVILKQSNLLKHCRGNRYH